MIDESQISIGPIKSINIDKLRSHMCLLMSLLSHYHIIVISITSCLIVVTEFPVQTHLTSIISVCSYNLHFYMSLHA